MIVLRGLGRGPVVGALVAAGITRLTVTPPIYVSGVGTILGSCEYYFYGVDGNPGSGFPIIAAGVGTITGVATVTANGTPFSFLPFACGVLGDMAGGPVVAVMQSWGSVDGLPILCFGDPVIPHGDDQHAAANMVTGSPWFTINNIPVCRTGDLASCGDILMGSRGWFIVP